MGAKLKVFANDKFRNKQYSIRQKNQTSPNFLTFVGEKSGKYLTLFEKDI